MPSLYCRNMVICQFIRLQIKIASVLLLHDLLPISGQVDEASTTEMVGSGMIPVPAA